MKIEMYVLCLLRFKDGRIVFTEPELTSINVAIGAGLQNQYLLTGDGQNVESRDGFKIYRLDSNQVQDWVGESAKIKRAKIGYYHHRVIIELLLDFAGDFSELREIRDQLKQRVDEMIEHCVKEKINELVYAKKIEREEARVEFFYTYPLIVVKKHRKKSQAFPFSEETGSLCFDIVEPSWVPPLGKRHMMRISIPSTNLYTQGKVGRDLLRDIVNSIYQYCLYEKKSMDKWPFENLLDESLLVKLWTHVTDCMGGRSIDVHTIRLTHATRFLALSALIISIITLTPRIIPLIKLLLQYIASILR